MTQRTVIKANASDAADIAAIHVASWKETYGDLLPESVVNRIQESDRLVTWKRILSEPVSATSNSVFVVKIADRIVGFAACGPQRSLELREIGYQGEINAIYILQAYQRKGLGLALFNAVASELKERKIERAALWVLRENIPARNFYSRCHGEVEAKKEDIRDSAVLVEVAYGWHDLANSLAST